jgi:uncharacterized repeat protein (TIGR03943 family)
MTRRRNGYLWLDIAAIAAWGFLFLKYWLTEKLYLLIHPNYFWLTIAAGFVLLGLALARAILVICYPFAGTSGPHLSLFPPGWSRWILIVTAIAGLLISPRAFASQTALERGISDSLTVTRVRPQAFRATVKPENRSIVDWIRTLTVYPEPDAYTGQSVSVKGFVVHSPETGPNYLLIARFIITCCAADAYPVSLPVKLPEGQRRDAYKPDSWQKVEGQMRTETLAGKRQLVIQATALSPVDEPKNPYDY